MYLADPNDACVADKGGMKNFINSTMFGLCAESGDCSCAEPYSWVNKDTLPAFWNLVYWSAQLLTWLMLPITASYMDAGQFTPQQRLKAALRENAILYGSLLFIVIIIVIFHRKVTATDG